MRLIAFLLLLVAPLAVAAQQSCVCTSGCTITAAPYAATSGATSCTVYKGGVAIATAPTVLSSSIPVNNSTTCVPASAAYNPGPAGSLACNVTIPPQPAGSVTLFMSVTTAAGESGQSGSFTFTSVAALPTVLPAPTNLRVE